MQNIYNKLNISHVVVSVVLVAILYLLYKNMTEGFDETYPTNGYVYSPQAMYDKDVAPSDGHTGVIDQYFKRKAVGDYQHLDEEADDAKAPVGAYSDYASYDGITGYTSLGYFDNAEKSDCDKQTLL